MKTRMVWLVAMTLVGCKGDDEPVEPLLDTGWFTPGGGSGCSVLVDSVVPADGAEGWYWRDPLQAFVSEAGGAYKFTLTQATGLPVPLSVVPDQTGLVLGLVPDAPLAPDTEFVLQIEDCEGSRTQSFRTSSLGLPLAGGPSAISGRTYQMDIEGAEWIQPGGFGQVLASLFTTPLLLNVRYVDDSVVDWLGGQGFEYDGRIYQSTQYATWDLPVAGFEASPYFEARAESVPLEVSEIPLTIYDFELTGTFWSDGKGFGGGTLAGLGDTRNAGEAIGFGDVEDALCQAAGDLGVTCVACPDGGPYCLPVQLKAMVAEEVEGLTLVPRVE